MDAAAIFWLDFLNNRRSIQFFFEISGIVVGKGGRRVRGDYYLSASSHEPGYRDEIGVCSYRDFQPAFRDEKFEKW